MTLANWKDIRVIKCGLCAEEMDGKLVGETLFIAGPCKHCAGNAGKNSDLASIRNSKRLHELAYRLAELDDEKTCPFCEKHEWGADKHEEGCPFALAYAALESK